MRFQPVTSQLGPQPAYLRICSIANGQADREDCSFEGDAASDDPPNDRVLRNTKDQTRHGKTRETAS
jgi:hypothetical protein